MPSINLAGDTEVTTKLGGLLSILSVATTLLFAQMKLKHILEHNSPSIIANSHSIEEGARYDAQRDDYAMAFGIGNFYEGIKDDPRFTQWLVSYNTADSDGNNQARHYLMHKCTDSEYAKFYPPDHDSKVKFELFKKSRSFYCFDLPEERDQEIYGYWQSGSNYAAIDIVLASCGN